MEFGRSDEGVAWFALLETFGKTPSEWGEQEDYQRAFMEAGYQELNERRQEKSK